MAAVDLWKSADGDWDADGSWESGAEPITGDVAILPNNSIVAVTSGLAQGAVDLDALITQPKYNQDIGTSGGHLVISAGRVLHEGGGMLYYTDGDGTTDLFIVNSAGGAVISGSVVTKIIVFKGNVTLDASLGAVSILDVSYVGAQASDAVVIIEQSAGTVTSLFMNGGNVTCSAAVTNLYIGAGTFTQKPNTELVTNIYQFGGTVNYKDATQATGVWKILGGMLDLGEVIVGTTDLVVDDLEIWPGARANIPKDLTSVTGGKLLDHTTIGRI